MNWDFESYQKLIERAREVALVGGARDLLSWDQETGMPAKALGFRADQLAHLSGWTHRLFTAPEVGAWISDCEQRGMAPEDPQTANVREWRRSYDRQTRLPLNLVEDFQRERALAREAWIEARRLSEFAVFQPHLAKLLELNRQMADCWGYAQSPYDALLDDYEPGMRASPLRELFATLKPAIAEALGPAREQSDAIPADFLQGHYPIENQKAFNHEVAQAMGFDFAAGRIDTTTHPFCSAVGPGDCRLTTRYNEQDFTQSLYGIMHEAGHGLYEQGLPLEHHGAPLGSAASLGIHESQSRLWENHVGRSRLFWEHWHPIACRHFPQLNRFSPLEISLAVNRVSPSFIRVEADRLTYDLHIILRFEIELRLLEGQLEVSAVPAAWNEEFEKLFGLKVTRDTEGCLQDIHWSLGAFGYFPTYTLGNLNAAQLFHRAKVDCADLEQQLGLGNYQPLLAWLRDKVHRHGQRYLPQQLMQTATGQTTQSHYHLEFTRRLF